MVLDIQGFCLLRFRDSISAASFISLETVRLQKFIDRGNFTQKMHLNILVDKVVNLLRCVCFCFSIFLAFFFPPGSTRATAAVCFVW